MKCDTFFNPLNIIFLNLFYGKNFEISTILRFKVTQINIEIQDFKNYSYKKVIDFGISNADSGF
jgi:hypothetical protein